MIIFTIIFLAFMEIALSFDNAIINAAVLKNMSPVWQRRFILWGMPIAVFGMRFAFPILIVCATAHLSITEVIDLALNKPQDYAVALGHSHADIAAFGGMFLLMVFLKFLCEEKEIYWLKGIENHLAKLGKLDTFEIFIALMALVTMQICRPDELFVLYGIMGVALYILTGMIMGDSEASRSGLGAFLYLEFLDASCSFDGVVGAFVLTDNILYIMIGLGIGAFAIRSLTLYLVRGGTLNEFIYLEHGAHYAIGALAIIMLVSIFYPVPEPVTGMVGISLIGLSLLSSIRHKKNLNQS